MDLNELIRKLTELRDQGATAVRMFDTSAIELLDIADVVLDSDGTVLIEGE
jgi:hypothetical protein